MFIEEVIIDGFKSYATRTVISGFDPKFNAITGLNGSGKSNILDAICFVLGISNLSHVRASNLQELVYKQGQAGVTKASVTIVFNNSDQKSSPVGYESYNTISVTRNVVLGGRNKYLINGHTAQVSQVHNLFHSVQLNVNNPHFLIMQGRITKVLNMKPPEILAMMEEAAGTRMYETKKTNALNVMEKKSKKVEEINRILSNDITPTLEKLRSEQASYLQWAANQAELERLERFCIAYAYTKALNVVNSSSDKVLSIENEVSEVLCNIAEKEGVKSHTMERIEHYKSTVLSSTSEEFRELVDTQESLEKELVTLDSVLSNEKKTLKSEESHLAELEDSINEARDSKTKVQEKLKSNDLSNNASGDKVSQIQILSKQLRDIQTGESVVNDANTLASLQSRKQKIDSEIASKEMQSSHALAELSTLEKKKGKTNDDDNNLSTQHDDALEKLNQCTQELEDLEFDYEHYEQLLATRDELETEVSSASITVHGLRSSLPSKLSLPSSITNKEGVKGVLASLFSIKNKENVVALETAGGSKLYHIAVDDEHTCKSILKEGKLSRRVTFVPLNRIKSTAGCISDSVLAAAKKIPGKAVPAVSCVSSEYENALSYVWGSTFICSSSNVAKKITFNPAIKCKSVTLDGDTFDPAGTLQGGSTIKTDASVFLKYQEYVKALEVLASVQSKLASVTKDIQRMQSQYEQYNAMSQDIELSQKNVECLAARVSASESGRIEAEIKTLKTLLSTTELELSDLSLESHEVEKEILILNSKQASSNAAAGIEKKLLQLKKEVEVEKDAVALQMQERLMQEAEVNTLEEEIQRLVTLRDDTCEDLKATALKVKNVEKKLTEKSAEFELYKSKVLAKKNEKKAMDSELLELEKVLEDISSDISNFNLQLQKLRHSLSNLTSEKENSEIQITKLRQSHSWIETESEFFNKPSTDYDFEKKSPSRASARLVALKESQNSLSGRINKKVLGMIEKAEGEYEGLMSKKEIIENDKTKIQKVIKELDTKKAEALQQTWTKVNRDFGDIFSTLLPGANAKLDTPEGNNASVMDGLVVKVCFGKVWKESLSELSGGQRSLLALSLILALLLFKPAPMYILDEVDAALDLSHTQNIGQMIKRHFGHSQFLVVSLKEGMFNNADVVFRTKFVDGVSTVTRTTTKTLTKK